MEEAKGKNYKWLALLTVSIGTFMETIDFSIVNISFPRLTKVFETELSVVLWVTVVYLLTSTGLLLILGRIGDVFSRKKVYILGFGLFTAGLIMCSLSQSIFQLILFRIVQGMGSAMLMSIGIAIIIDAFPNEERGKAIGLHGAMISAGLLSGPVLGGFLLDTLDWRAIFYIRAPVGIIGLIMGWILLREQKKSNIKVKFDLWGAATLFGSLCCFLLFINLGGEFGFLSTPVLILAASTVILLVLFLVQEIRTEQPLVDLNLFRNRLFAGGNLGQGIIVLTLSAQILLMPFYMINGLGYSTTKTGLLLATASVATAVIGPLSGWLSDKIGTRQLCIVGMVLICAALFLFSSLGTESSDTDILLRLVIYGIGIGIFFSPNTSSIMGAVPKDRLGTASAMISTVRQIGLSSGMALAGTIFISRQSFHTAELTVKNFDPLVLHTLSLISSYQDTVLMAAIVCSIGILTFIAFIRRKPS